MDYSEKWGRDVDEAVKLALEDLKVSIDEVDVTVLEEPSRGFFGIGSKLALVRVEKKKTEEPEPEPPAPAPQPEVKTEAPKKQKKEKKNRQERSTKEIKTQKPVQEVLKEDPEEELQVLEDHKAITFLNDVIREMGLNAMLPIKQERRPYT